MAEREQLYSNILSQDFDLIRAGTPSAIVPAAIGPSDAFVRDSANERFAAFPFLGGQASNRVDLGEDLVCYLGVIGCLFGRDHQN